MKRRLCVLALLLAMTAAPAFGQGCIMCYEGATGASTSGQKALTEGGLVLLIPPVGLMTLLVGFAFRYGRERDEVESLEHEPAELTTQ